MQQLGIALVRRVAIFLAELWLEFADPLPYDQVSYPGGVRVRVRVERYVSVEDTQPMRAAVELETMYAEQSADA